MRTTRIKPLKLKVYPDPKTQTSLNKAFRELRKLEYFAKQNWKCCQICGCAAIPKENNDYVFYHAQDKEMWLEGGEMYLAWAGDGAEIVNVFENAGFLVEWDGSEGTRICIKQPEAKHYET